MSKVSDEQIDARKRLQEALDAFDADASYHLANESERADLWEDIEVNAGDLRQVLSASSLNPEAEPVAWREAMHNMIVLAIPYFRDEAQMLALSEARDTLLAPPIAPSPISKGVTDDGRPLVDELTGALRFIMAFYEPGQTYLDTNAWKVAEAGGRNALAKGEAFLTAQAAIAERESLSHTAGEIESGEIEPVQKMHELADGPLTPMDRLRLHVYDHETFDFLPEDAEAILDGIEAADKRIAELEAALKPFADYELSSVAIVGDDEKPPLLYRINLAVGSPQPEFEHFRHARAALEPRQ